MKNLLLAATAAAFSLITLPSHALGAITDIQTVPEHPTSVDVVVITLSGSWGNSCVPVGSTISVTGNDIYFDVIAAPPSICAHVITPWSRTRSVGPLSPGTYAVYACIVRDANIPQTYTKVAEFSVTEEAHMPTIYYVNAVNGDDNNDGLTEETAYATIQKAVDVAKSADTVIVAQGIYTGTGNHNINFCCKAITVRSLNPADANVVANTIISCGGPDSGFDFHSNEGPNSVVTGFTITECRYGIRCFDYSSPTICHCIITQNCEAGYPAGIWCKDSSPTITNCIVGDNSSGYGIWIHNGSPYIADSVITNNVGVEHGAGLYCIASDPTISNCIISYNSAGFYGGGMLLAGESALISNCIIAHNSANWGGGGISCSGKNTFINNCTFVANSSPEGSALRCSTTHSSPKNLNITNCVLWDNGNEIFTDDSTTASIAYSNVQGGCSGFGNIDIDPCFVDPNANDFHLLPDSPCINAGDPNYMPEPNETDLDGLPRIIGGRIDMGAYEFNHCPIANAGPNQIAYACLDGLADVNLDGSASYDDDNDLLNYYWSWFIDPNLCEVNGVSPTIQLPIGEHEIELIVDDGIDESEPDSCTITVIEPIRARLWITPRAINCRLTRPQVLAVIYLPQDIEPQDLNNQPLVMYPGQIQSTYQRVYRMGRGRHARTIVMAVFNRDDICSALQTQGRHQVRIAGWLTTGQYFYGIDSITIIKPRPHRRPFRPLLRRN